VVVADFDGGMVSSDAGALLDVGYDDKFIGRVGAPSLHAKSETPIVFPAYVPAFDRWPR
jgi:hypothetical protein